MRSATTVHDLRSTVDDVVPLVCIVGLQFK